MSDFNGQIIAEFRASGGKVGGMFEGRPLLLLTSTGRRSGRPRTAPLVYRPDGHDRYVVAASNGGGDDHPQWFGNVVAEPAVTVELGADRTPMRATVLRSGSERDRLWEAHKANLPGFSDYETTTDRTIPMVVLAPA